MESKVNEGIFTASTNKIKVDIFDQYGKKLGVSLVQPQDYSQVPQGRLVPAAFILDDRRIQAMGLSPFEDYIRISKSKG